MKVIGITGPTGAGKTTALGALEDLGGTLIDCDELYHTLLEESEELRAALVARFGDILDRQGRPDRKKLGAIVFDKAK
ncbi:MAG: dephospho-CoA kinase, partial [Pseudoflavonifractor sp.]